MAEALLKQLRPPSPAQHPFVESPAYKWWVTWTMMLGGYLTDTVSWRMIFYINIPIGIIGVGMAVTIMAAEASS